MGQYSVRAVLQSALVYFFFLNAVFGQEYNGTLKGQVVDASGTGVVDQTVIVSSLKTGFRRMLTTDGKGRFQTQLVPGDYVISTAGQGYSSVRVERVAVGLGSNVDLSIDVAETPIEEIVVFGEATPLMKTAVGETGLQLSLEEIAHLPVTRDIDAVALLAPGTVPGVSKLTPVEASQPLVSFGGSSVAENAYYVDGLNVSEFRKGLGGSAAPFEFYDQIQLKTGAFSAEFGRATGGVINAVTRRGSNDFEFGVVSYVTPEWGQGASPDTYDRDGELVAYDSERRESGWTIDAYAGGPIVKDRLFFFALYEPRESFRRSGTGGRMTEALSTDAFWGGNLTWNVNDYHSLSYTAFTDRQRLDHTDFDYDVDERIKGDLIGTAFSDAGGDNVIATYSGQLSDRLSVSALYGINKDAERTWSTNDVDCPAVQDYTQGPGRVLAGCNVRVGIGFYKHRRDAYRLDVAYAVGNHTLRLGLDQEDRESISHRNITGDSIAPDLPGGVLYYIYYQDVGTSIGTGATVPDANGDGSPVVIVEYRYIDIGGNFQTDSRSWYLEDVWDVNDSITLSLGLRNESFRNANADGDRFFDIADQWAPRLGLAWSPKGSVDHTVTLNWGRFQQPMMALPVVALGAGSFLVNRYFVHDGQRDPRTAAPLNVDGSGAPTSGELGSPEVVWDGSAVDTRANLDTNLEPMYQDEWMLGYERRLNANWKGGIRYIHRDLKSVIDDVGTMAGLEAIGFPGATDESQACSWVLTNPGTDISTFCDIDGVLTETVIPAEALGIPKGHRTYDAVEVVMEKSLSNRWMFHGSYTWSRSRGNTEGLTDSDTGISGAHYTVWFDDWQLMDGAYGYLPNDRRHKLKLWGLYEITDRLSVSAIASARSGKPINAFGRGHPDGTVEELGKITFYVRNPDGSFSFNPRGSAGRTDWTSQVDLSVLYELRSRGRALVELRADVFNLFDADTATEVNEMAELQPELFMLPVAYQRPRQIRFGVAVRF